MDIVKKDMNVILTAIDDLIGYDKNARTHSDHQIEEIANSITNFGFNDPIEIGSDNIIISGHARLSAAQKLGLTHVPTIVHAHLNASNRKAYILAANRIAMSSSWDDNLLKDELCDLNEDGFDLSLTGFTSEEIDGFLNNDEAIEGNCDEDECGDVKEDVISKLGNIWVLGEHRLMCGDSTSIDDVDKLMNGVKADMVFTDPPYGVNFKQGQFCGQTKAVKARNFSPIKNDEKQGEELKQFLKQVFTNLLAVTDVCSIYSWSPPLAEGFSILTALIESGWHIQSQIIWNKSSMVMGRCDYHWKHEVCWYGYKGKNHKWNGGRTKVSVWDVKKQMVSDLHPTMKPVELAEMACINSTNIGDNVIDLFGGSGSTLIACEKNKRKCYMMELDNKYCDVIIRRWMKFTGKKAVLESTGEYFE